MRAGHGMRFRLKNTDIAQFAPPVPRSIQEMNIPDPLIQDLILRKLFIAGQTSGVEIAKSLCMPYNGVVEVILQRLYRDQIVEFTGGQGYGRAYFDYGLTEKGRDRARDCWERCSYIGPAPISLGDYTAMVRRQMLDLPAIDRSDLVGAFHDMVVEPGFFERLGPAVNSVRSLFLYGPPGNGKTSIAERIASILHGEIFVPFALEVDGQIIQIYDPLVCHPIEAISSGISGDDDALLPLEDTSSIPLEALEAAARAVNAEIEDGQTVEMAIPKLKNKRERREITAGKAGKVVEIPAFDPRWVLAERPRIIVGGELTLDDLELTYSPSGRFYEAPHQIKACAGMLLIDDFGRQKVHPTDLLNRWIVPLEKKVDYLTLKTGKKFEMPFDLLIIFSTNLDPSKLVDEAFLRRIRYKIEVPNPTEHVYRQIFIREAERQGVKFNREVLDHLILKYYRASGRHLRSCHPRDILQLLLDHARFLKCEAAMTRSLVEQSCDAYFVHMEGDPDASRANAPVFESLLK